MPRAALIFVVLLLVLHGLIHLMGLAVYMKLAEVQGLAYKTTLLGGRLDLGDAGIRVFGALWFFPALGFVVTALALVAETEWWETALVATTLLSLVLTSLDWSVAFAGAIVDVAILVLLWLGPRVVGQLA